MSDVKMSLFRGFSDKNPETITESQFVDLIKHDQSVKHIIQSARDALGENDRNLYDSIKQQLPAVTTSAICEGGRKKSDIKELNNLLCLDVDKLQPHEFEKLKSEFQNWKHTRILFTSPSGNGLKVVVQTNADLINFKESFQQIYDYIQNEFNVECDPACKDPNRLCFLSHDPQVYYNPESDVIEYVEPEPSVPTPAPVVNKIRRVKKNPTATTATAAIDVPTPILRQLEKVEEFTSRISKFEEGNRNNYIHLFASNANRVGIDESHVDAYCQKFVDVDFTEQEIEKIIYPVYYRNQDEYSSSKMSLPKHDFKTIAEEASISEDVFQNLPSKIYELVNYFSGQTRDVVLLSLLASLSGAMYWIRGWLSDYVIYPNLFAMQIGNAGSGKGAAQHSMDVLKKIEECFNDSYDVFDNTENLGLVIAGNNSVSNMVIRIKDNKGAGIIFETEADAMSSNYGNEWGDATDKHRKAFHNEAIKYERMENGIHYCPCPHYSINITGTPDQIKGIVRSKENGMVSRFIYYLLRSNPEYIKQRPKKNGQVRIHKIKELTNDVLGKWYAGFKGKKVMFELTDQQWTKFDEINAELFYNWKMEYGIDKHDLIVRNNTMKFKIMMIITALRTNGENIVEEGQVIKCKDVDFDIAMSLGEIIFKGSLYASELITNKNNFNSSNSYLPYGKLDEVLNRLEPKFKTAEYIKSCNQSNIPERTAYRYLNNCDKIRRIRRGWYEKIAS